MSNANDAEVFVGTKVPIALHKRMEAHAKKEDVSIASILRRALALFFKSKKP